MSSAIQAPPTASAGAYQAPPTPLRFDETQALYALWKNVFASSREAGNARDDSQSAPGDASVSQDTVADANRSGVRSKVADAADRSNFATERDLNNQQATLSRNAVPRPAPTGAMVMLGGSDAAPLAEPTTEVGESPGTLQAEIPDSSAMLMLIRAPGAGAAQMMEPGAAPLVEHGADLDSDTETAAEPPRVAEETLSADTTRQTPADSVNIFVHGSAVAIVVRDSGISDHEAVNCAFETARKLTGQRTGLAQLTLNGRILYQQSVQASAHSSAIGKPASAALAFAC